MYKRIIFIMISALLLYSCSSINFYRNSELINKAAPFSVLFNFNQEYMCELNLNDMDTNMIKKPWDDDYCTGLYSDYTYPKLKKKYLVKDSLVYFKSKFTDANIIFGLKDGVFPYNSNHIVNVNMSYYDSMIIDIKTDEFYNKWRERPNPVNDSDLPYLFSCNDTLFNLIRFYELDNRWRLIYANERSEDNIAYMFRQKFILYDKIRNKYWPIIGFYHAYPLELTVKRNR